MVSAHIWIDSVRVKITLSEAQRIALEYIDGSPGKSGKFWRDLGISPQSLSGLERRNLIKAEYRIATSETTILSRRWFLTDVAVVVLESLQIQKEGK